MSGAIRYLLNKKHKINNVFDDYANLSLLDFIVRVHQEIYSETFIIKPFHYEICDLLTMCAERKLPKGKYIVIINMPFRYSKTQIIVYYMVWCFLKNPKAKFLYFTYADKLSFKTSREVKNILMKLFNKKSSFSKDAAQLWELNEGGSLWSTSSLGAATGYGASNLQASPYSGDVIGDDPLKALDAFWQTKMNTVNENLTTTFWSRRNNLDLVPFILMQQRLNIKDQSNYLMEKYADACIVYTVKGIDEYGESTFPERVSKETFNHLKEASPFTYYAQVQQSPKGYAGDFFILDKIKTISVAEFRQKEWMMKYWVRAWDFAGVKRMTKINQSTNNRDFTRGVLMTTDGEFVYISHVASHRGTVDKNAQLLVKTAMGDGWRVHITIAEDPGAAGQFYTDFLQTLPELSGYSLTPLRPTLNKSLRAAPFASLLNTGKIILVDDIEDEYRWNNEVMEELAAFPNSDHDDIVDACSDCIHMIHNVNKFI